MFRYENIILIVSIQHVRFFKIARITIYIIELQVLPTLDLIWAYQIFVWYNDTQEKKTISSQIMRTKFTTLI